MRHAKLVEPALQPFAQMWVDAAALSGEVRPAVSLQRIIWDVLEHDIHHGSEISTILGVHGLPVVELDLRTGTSSVSLSRGLRMMRLLKLQGRPWSFSGIPCSHGQKKGKNWMQRRIAETCFLAHKSPFRRLIQSTHTEFLMASLKQFS